MRKNQSQNQRPLLKKEVFTDVSHADKQRSRQREGECQLAQACGLIGIKGVAFTGEVAERQKKEYRQQCSNKSANVHKRPSVIASLYISKFHLCSESDDNCVVRASARIGEILHDWLQ